MFFQNKTYKKKPLLNKYNIKFIQKQNQLIKRYDSNIIKHNISVAEISYYIGLKLESFNHEELSNLYFSALLHDIGKIFLSKKVLNKPDRLNSKEMQYVQQHSSFGAEYIEQCFDKKNILGLKDTQKEQVIFHIKHHHELLDGSGYPSQFDRKNIPLSVQILTLADVYSALDENRVYKNSWDTKEIFKYLKSNSSKWFNKTMIELLENTIDKQDKQLVNN